MASNDTQLDEQELSQAARRYERVGIMWHSVVIENGGFGFRTAPCKNFKCPLWQFQPADEEKRMRSFIK